MQTFRDKAKDASNNGEFEGYGDQGAFTMLPRLFMHFQFQDLSESALKVMLYIFSHTWGYSDPCSKKGQRKNADAISRSQFLEGVQRSDGTIVDRGAGVSDRSLDRALIQLVELGYIFIHRRYGSNGRCDTNIYELNIDGTPHWSESAAEEGVGGSNKIREGGNSNGNTNKLVGDKSNATPANLATFTSTTSKATPAIEVGSGVKITSNQGANLAKKVGVNLPDTTYRFKQHTTNHDTNNTTAESVKRETVQPIEPTQGLGSVCVDLPGNYSVKDSPQERARQTSPSYQPNPDSIGTREREKTSYSSPPVSIASSPSQITTPTPASPNSSSALTNSAFVVLNQALLAVSISKVEAHKLAALAVHNGHGADYVERALAYVDDQRDVKSRPGLLIHLVKTNWQPSSAPAGVGVAVSESGTASTSNPAAQVVGVLPTLATVNPLHVPKLIQIEARNLREATNDRQRVTAQARLERLKEIEKQLAARQSQQSLEMATMLGTLNQHTHSSNTTKFSTGV